MAERPWEFESPLSHRSYGLTSGEPVVEEAGGASNAAAKVASVMA